MARYLIVRNGAVRNVVDYPSIPDDTTPEGDIVVPDPTGTTNVGDAYDSATELFNRRYSKLDTVVAQELFRLTNAVRVLQGQTALTAGQYKAFLKTL